MTHAVPPDLCFCYLNTTALADNALEPDPLVLTAEAFPVFGRTKDFFSYRKEKKTGRFATVIALV